MIQAHSIRGTKVQSGRSPVSPTGRRRQARLTLQFTLVLILLFAAFPVRAAEEIKPPFGLQWGESSERLEKLLQGAKATIVERRNVQDKQAWTVEGLVQAGLRRTIFYLKDDMLVEVELQYQTNEWDTARYDEFMGKVRRTIEQKYGAGQLIARQKQPEGDIMQTVVGYKWNQNNTSIQLFYFAAETPSQIYRTVSVHYKSY
jgi:hypothetical protein